MPCTYYLLYQCSNRPKRCVVDFFLNLDAPRARLCINFLSLSLTWGLLSNIFVLFDLFSPACGLLSEFWEYFSSLFAFFFGTFCRFLTFGATFLYLKSIFSWNGYKRKKKCKKMQKRTSKLADLVCTKEFFLYKSGQISNKCESDFLVCYLFLLATVWTCDKHGQMPPNDTKGNDFCWCSPVSVRFFSGSMVWTFNPYTQHDHIVWM